MYDSASGDETSPGGGAPGTPTPDPWTPDELAAARAWANSYYTGHKIPTTYGTVDDLINNYLAQRRAGVGHQQAMDTVPGILGWDKYTAPVDPTTGGGSGGGSGTTNPGTPGPNTGPLTSPLTRPFDQPFVAPTPLNLGGPVPGLPAAPSFSGPAFPTIPKFTMPSAADVLADPGHAFRVSEGQRAIQNWAAAKGTLNDSSTADALTRNAEDIGTQDYENVFNRAWNVYRDNVSNNYLLPWQAANAQWLSGVVNPGMTVYGTESAAGQHANDVNYANARNAFLQDRDYFSNWQDRVFSKLFDYARA